MPHFGTAQAGLNGPSDLIAYLDGCGRNNGKPFTGPDLPWNADPADLRAWAQRHPPG
jgi:hypothetical protein